MKGISPIVASVLLIAITMTIAGVLAYWSATFIGQSLPVENITTSQCRFAQFEIISCRYNGTSGAAVVILENVKDVELLNLTVFVTYSDSTLSAGIPLNASLGKGIESLKSFSISNIPSNFSQITIKTNCPELSRSHTCLR